MHLLLTAPTPPELAPTLARLRPQATTEEKNTLQFDNHTLEILFTGLGPVLTAFTLGHRLATLPLPDLAIQAGVGGALDPALPLTTLVRITSDRFADLGAEDQDGSWLNPTQIGFAPAAPFTPDGRLLAAADQANLPFPAAHGLTVSRATGSAKTIEKLRAKYPEAQVESMEGAAFFYACQQVGVEAIQLRAISNYVEPRNRSAWRMGEAIGALNDGLRPLLEALLS